MMSNVELCALIDNVTDELSFIVFLEALHADRADGARKEKVSPSSPYGPDANGWENTTVEAFLEVAAVWARDSINGLEFYQKPDNPWKRCADILYAGKICE